VSGLRRRWLVGLGVALACWLAVGVLPAGALSATDVELLGSRNAEIYPAANDTMLAWSENSARHPRIFNMYVRPLAGGHATRLNAEGTRGYSGAFDGPALIFQQITNTGHSDLREYDTDTKQFVPVPDGVNTGKWEAAPSIDGDYILFDRSVSRRRHYTIRLVLHRISTGHEEILGSVSGPYRGGPEIAPGQLNGDLATWDVCSRAQGCDVFLHRISTGHTQKIADRQQEYASSLASDGTVFFIRSGVGCGTKARLMRYVSGTAEVVRTFAKNRDSFDTYALSPTQLVREVDNCRTGDANVNETTIS
jgi:hypothetical protein